MTSVTHRSGGWVWRILSLQSHSYHEFCKIRTHSFGTVHIFLEDKTSVVCIFLYHHCTTFHLDNIYSSFPLSYLVQWFYKQYHLHKAMIKLLVYMVKNYYHIPHLTEAASMSIAAARTTDISLLCSVDCISLGIDRFEKFAIKIGSTEVDLLYNTLQKKNTWQKPQYSTISYQFMLPF